MREAEKEGGVVQGGAVGGGVVLPCGPVAIPCAPNSECPGPPLRFATSGGAPGALEPHLSKAMLVAPPTDTPKSGCDCTKTPEVTQSLGTKIV